MTHYLEFLNSFSEIRKTGIFAQTTEKTFAHSSSVYSVSKNQKNREEKCVCCHSITEVPTLVVRTKRKFDHKTPSVCL